MNLVGTRTEELEARWETLIPKYSQDLKNLKHALLQVSKVYNELSIIREELLSRGVEVEGILNENMMPDEVSDECLDPEMKKIS